jgi:magnesium-transporting ATPase (P-type)
MAPGQPSPSVIPPAWHAAPAEAVLARLGVHAHQGLSDDEVDRRRAETGKNVLPPPRRRGPLLRLLLQFHDLLIYMLLGAAVVTAALGHWADSSVILAVVVINALIGFLQEGKAERALDAIQDLLPLQAQVLRAGVRREVAADELVPGDIVFLAAGDKVPADLRLIEARSLRVAEATLTGESVASEKQACAVPIDASLGDRSSMAFASTLVAYGQGAGVVVATGPSSEVGRISAMLAQVEELSTPLTRQIAQFGRWLTAATLLLAGLAFGYGTQVQGYPATDMFMAAVGLAVALIPEGLPAIVTITLAIGVSRMAGRNAIVRRLPAVEALGSVTVICTDKTGTLTRNEMTVTRVLTSNGDLSVSGAGYAPHGGFSRDVAEVEAAGRPDLLELARAGLLCNDAVLSRSDGHWRLAGDPTEGALVTLALKAGLDDAFERENCPRDDVIPFDAEHRFMATLHHDHADRRFIVLKGAPERILPLCRWQTGAGGRADTGMAGWLRRLDETASQGMRLLAIASRRVDTAAPTLHIDDVLQGGFTLLGVVGLSDPPREEAIEAVQRCRAAGIRVKMITGDHVATARSIGARLGLGPALRACSGTDLAADASELAVQAADCDVFARASPEDKLRLVNALQGLGEVVAMTGDGVNDAPALKRADVGVAMGRKGTEAAKEAAEIVLADDNFASIAAAVEEGRAVYDNIRKAIAFTLPTNGGEAGMLLMAILLGLTMPITPVQILWVNMITEVTLSLSLAFEAPEQDVMRRPPRSPQAPILSGFLVWRVAFVTVLMVSGGIGLFLWELGQGAPLPVARTAAVNAIVIGEIAYLFNARSLLAPSWGAGALRGNRYILAAVTVLVVFQLLFTYLPAAQDVFGTASLGPGALFRIVVFGAVLFLVVELEKMCWRTRSRRAAMGDGGSGHDVRLERGAKSEHLPESR